MDYRTKIEERLRAAFGDVMLKANELVDDALDAHFDDIQKIFLRDRTVSVSLGMAIDMNEAGQIGVGLTTGYVKERVKDKTTARVTPGQERLPFEAQKPEPAAAEDEVPAGEPAHLHPFFAGFAGGGVMLHVDTESRLARVKEMVPEQLRQVITLPNCQKSVVKAAEVRLRKLEKNATVSP